MAEDNSKIEVDRKLLGEFFKMADMQMPEDVSDENLIAVMEKIKNQKPQAAKNESLTDSADSDTNTKNILVIDDIGVVTYQLKVLLQNLGYNVDVAKDIFNGINFFIRHDYLFVVMDLFVSTEQEGYTLLNETKKIITQNNLKTKIVVITASNKAENRIRCLNGGADYFLKKDAGWQDKLVELIENR